MAWHGTPASIGTCSRWEGEGETADCQTCTWGSKAGRGGGIETVPFAAEVEEKEGMKIAYPWMRSWFPCTETGT